MCPPSSLNPPGLPIWLDNKESGNEDLQQVRARMSGWIQMFILRDHWPVIQRVILFCI